MNTPMYARGLLLAFRNYSGVHRANMLRITNPTPSTCRVEHVETRSWMEFPVVAGVPQLAPIRGYVSTRFR